jgi:putative FmdB family regulatory protein
MAIYQLRCGQGHDFEVIQSFTAPLPACPDCGGEVHKVPSRCSLSGRGAVSLPPPPEAMPQTWRGTYEGNPEYLGQLRRQWNDRQKLEEKYDELRGDQRPVLAHEGRYHAAPLRGGDPAATPPTPSAPPTRSSPPASP